MNIFSIKGGSGTGGVTRLFLFADGNDRNFINSANSICTHLQSDKQDGFNSFYRKEVKRKHRRQRNERGEGVTLGRSRSILRKCLSFKSINHAISSDCAGVHSKVGKEENSIRRYHSGRRNISSINI